MDETIVKIYSLTNTKTGEIEVLVDTGATYTMLPEFVLQNLDVKVMSPFSFRKKGRNCCL